MTPMRVKALEFPKGVALTGKRQTCITYSSNCSDDHLGIRPMEVDNGLSHSGDPDEEVIVLEEPKREDPGPRVVHASRAPTQKEIEANEATHVPHEEWCEFCMAGRARSKPHRRKRQGEDQPQEGRSEGPGDWNP